MPKAARITDPCMHPAARISTGSPDTIIGNQKAARLGDHSNGCKVPIPTPPHVGGTLSKCSLKVFINFLPAARVGDLLICPAPGPTGPPGGPKHSAKAYEVVRDDDIVSLVYVQTRNGDWDKDQSRAKVDPGKVTGGHDYTVPAGQAPATNPKSPGAPPGNGPKTTGVGNGPPDRGTDPGPPGGGGAAAYFDVKSKLLIVSTVSDANELIRFSFDVPFGFRLGLPILAFGTDVIVDGYPTVFIGG